MEITSVLRDRLLEAAIAPGGPLDPTKTFVGVANEINPQGHTTTFSNIKSPSSTVGARQVVKTWGKPHTLPDGRRAVDSPVMYFRPKSAEEATCIAGWYLADAETGGNLLTYTMTGGRNPTPLVDENSVFAFIVRFTVDPSGKWDASVVIREDRRQQE